MLNGPLPLTLSMTGLPKFGIFFCNLTVFPVVPNSYCKKILLKHGTPLIVFCGVRLNSGQGCLSWWDLPFELPTLAQHNFWYFKPLLFIANCFPTLADIAWNCFALRPYPNVSQIYWKLYVALEVQSAHYSRILVRKAQGCGTHKIDTQIWTHLLKCFRDSPWR